MHTSSVPLAEVQSVNTIKGRRSQNAALVIAITKKSKQKGEHSCGRMWGEKKKQFVQQIGCGKCLFIYYINQLQWDGSPLGSARRVFL